jgi:hypothetical protein
MKYGYLIEEAARKRICVASLSSLEQGKWVIERRGGSIEKRRLHQRMGRHSAIFHRVLEELVQSSTLHIKGNLVVMQANGRDGETCASVAG